MFKFKRLIFFLSGLFLQIPLPGQVIRVNFDQMWQIALRDNTQIKNAELMVERSRSMEKTAWNFGTLDFEFTRGQQNTELIDNMYTLKQGLGAPFTISATRKYYASEQDFYRRNVDMVMRDTKKSLRYHYYNWLYENRLIGLLDSSIVVYRKASEFAELQYNMGESNLLSKALLASELERLVLRRDLHAVSLRTTENEIKTLLNTDSTYVPVEQQLDKIVVLLREDTDLLLVDSVPDVMAQKSHLELMDRYYRLTKSEISPSLSAGYYNQEIDHVPGYQGWLVGVSFPLLFIPHRARSQAAYIELSRAENAYQFEKLKTRQEIGSLLAKYEQMQESLDYYENQRLSNAELIVQNAEMLYESGDIGYIELVQNLTTARQIWEEYLLLIKEYNQQAIDLFYYLEY